jgi:hypothetical protein
MLLNASLTASAPYGAYIPREEGIQLVVRVGKASPSTLCQGVTSEPESFRL